ncbi:MAG: hypothetical protein OEN02_19580, partial [Gammaproteobacteria bacterium]|nr:hypothetical protein [Gammaproteobacteria bacterium]
MKGSLDLESRDVTRVALLGRDYRGVNPELLCAEGETVSAGAALMRDARRPDIRFSAPAAGRIARIERGARRRLVSVQIDVDDAPGSTRYDAPADYTRDSMRAFMLACGVWSSLRTRPFGNIPDPDGKPAAIFITALDAEPQAPEARPVIESFSDEFRAATKALASISEAPLYVCHAPDHALALEAGDRVRCVPFGGGPTAGLPGVHINALCPIGFAGGQVWHLGYQEAIAFGHLLLHGTPWLRRVISIGGNGVTNPRCLQVTPGADLGQLLAGELVDAATRILAGSPLCGRPLPPGQAFLGAGQRQVTVFDISPGDTVSGHPVGGAVIPGDRLEGLAPPGIFAVPLMRALQLGDAERARELGALELVEEDVAPLG